MLFDDYDIDGQFHKLKGLIDALQPDIYKFIGSGRHKTASRRARNTLSEMVRTCKELKKSIILQREDNESQY